MTHNYGFCPRCGWPIDAPGTRTLSLHATADGDLRYRRCPCGAIHITRAGTVITTVGRLA